MQLEASRSPIEPGGIFDGLKPRAILVGALVDTVATIAGSVLLFGLFAGSEAFSEDEAVSQEAFDSLAADPVFLGTSLVLGLLCTVVGGFVGSWRAGSLHLRHGGWVAVASALLGLLLLAFPAEAAAPPPPLWFDFLGWALMLPSGVLGGALAGALQSRHAA